MKPDRRTALPSSVHAVLMTVLAGASLCTAMVYEPSTALAQWPDIGTDSPPLGGGDRDAAVIIGVDDYVFVPDVTGAADSASAWYHFMTSGLSVPTDRVTLLRNHEGTREKILRHVAAAAGKVKPGGQLWVIFIGHGAPGKAGRGGVLIGADAQAEADSLYARSVTRDELLSASRQGNAGGVVAVLDACFSGQLADRKPIVPGLQPLIPSAVAKPAPGTLVLSAGTADQFAGPLPNTASPAFSYLLLGALRGWADTDGDKRVTAREAIDYTTRVLATVVTDRTQTPTLEGNDRAVLTERAVESGPDLASIVGRDQPVAAATAPEHDGNLYVNVGDDGVFNVQVIASDGELYRCSETTDQSPCHLKLPKGRAELRLSGASSFRAPIDIGQAPAVVDVTPPFRGGPLITLLSAAGGGVGIVMLTTADPHEDFGVFFGGLMVTMLGLGGTATGIALWAALDYDVDSSDFVDQDNGLRRLFGGRTPRTPAAGVGWDF